jgi:hypothetical protein
MAMPAGLSDWQSYNHVYGSTGNWNVFLSHDASHPCFIAYSFASNAVIRKRFLQKDGAHFAECRAWI